MGALEFTSKPALLILALFSLSGCGSLKYLLQAGEGQMALFNRAKPISEVVKDERTPIRIRTLLTEIPAIKEFGEKNGLRSTANYTEYVKLDRPAAVWVVSACEPLSFKSKEWKFPIVGAFPYIGWFDLGSAKEYAETLKKEGWDVDVRGAGAYSTLGWFRDAVLSSMIPEGKEALGELVNVVLHESVHATLYISGQAYFNESVASFVADHLTLDYLNRTKGKQSLEELTYLEGERKHKEIYSQIHQAYLTLEKVYSSTDSDSVKSEKKFEIINRIQSQLKIKRAINNATIIQYKTYSSGGKEFDELLHACGFDWTQFMASLKTLNSSSFSKPQQEDLKEPISGALKECRSRSL